MNLHTEFKRFDENIKLTTSKKEQILRSRNAVRDKIRSYFKVDLKTNQPKFMWQGSFAMNLALNPIDENEVDIDDGLYLKHVNENDIETWPTPKETHKMILNALKDHTQTGCEDKTSCVRVIYKNTYHVDIPIYIMHGSHAKLANVKSNKWETSDSKDFRDWFYNNRKDEQTSRIVRYLKAWRDYKNLDFASIELTILVTRFHIRNEDDGLALKLTIDNIYTNLSTYKKIEKPVAPYENLWAGKENEIDLLLKSFKQLKDDLTTIYNSESKHRASLILREQFGDRFPLIKENQDNTKENNWSPKPWGNQ